MMTAAVLCTPVVAAVAYLMSPNRLPQLSDRDRDERRRKLRFVGHRGASHTLPENTMAAFAQALKLVGAFELDLSVLADGVTVVVLHDDTLRRTAPGAPSHLLDRNISSLSLHDVQGIDVGSWHGSEWSAETLPQFGAALRLLLRREHVEQASGGRAPHCFAELKSDGAYLSSAYRAQLPAAAEATARAEGIGPGSLTWISFSLDLCIEMKRRMADYSVLLIGFAKTSHDAWKLARICVESGLDGIDVQADRRVVSAELCTWLHERGKMIAVWAWRAPAKNDRPALWEWMADAGVDVFTSNLPPSIGLWTTEQRVE